MKISSLITLSGLLATGAVQAQTQSATIYGMIDTGVEAVSNVSGVGTITRMPSTTGILPSRL